MSILIGADFVPTESNINDFISGNAEKLFGKELLEILNTADYRIFNLEVPLSDIERPISKCGPNLIAPCAAVTGYAAIHVDLLTLANNHVLDQGEQGLQSTFRSLDSARINRVGAGKTAAEAAKTFVFEQHGCKIGVYACAEHEFSIVSQTCGGANPFDPLETPDHIAALKKQCDHVVVLYHGGKEYYRYPSPMLQKRCRKLVEKGADLVVCQHSHCIGCEEKYLHGTIVYGQGNFLFDGSEDEMWQTSLLISLDREFHISYLPIIKVGAGIRKAPSEQATAILAGFHERSAEICRDGFVEDNYAVFAGEMRDRCLLALGGKHSFFFRVLNRLSGRRLGKCCLRTQYGEQERNRLRNYMECESWREVILEGLSKNESG